MFWTRFISSIGLLIVFVFVYLMANTIVMNIFVAFVAAACVYELFKAVAKDESKAFSYPSMAFAAALPFVAMLGRDYVLAATIIYILAFFVFLLNKFGKIALDNIVMSVFFTLFISLSMNSMVYIASDKSHMVTLPLIFAASVTDVFAYLVGVTMGKHKLVVKISPKKTIEGSVGGVLGCGIFIYIYAAIINYYTSFTINIPALIALGVLIAIVSQIGDLSMSVLKRTYGVKDFGKLIPGHGGVLDRMDSWLFVLPIIFLFVKLFTLVS